MGPYEREQLYALLWNIAGGVIVGAIVYGVIV